MINKTISVLTIVHQREEALDNLLAGLRRSQVLPGEVIIVHMNEAVREYPPQGYPLRTHQIMAEGHLPLAEARNLAAAKANGDKLVFLDADCIPAPDLTGRYAAALEGPQTLWTGAVRYLHNGAASSPELFDRPEELSRPDPVRDHRSAMRYELFWSLNFGCSKATFSRIGGFDPAFCGYGAEDTDFAFSARRQGVPVQWTAALAYHQHHASYDPPLNHLADIVKNAKVFKAKWGSWPMEGWLKKFAAAGFIRWDDEGLSILRLPAEAEIRAALKL